MTTLPQELARAKAVFQQRTIAAYMGGDQDNIQAIKDRLNKQREKESMGKETKHEQSI